MYLPPSHSFMDKLEGLSSSLDLYQNRFLWHNIWKIWQFIWLPIDFLSCKDGSATKSKIVYPTHLCWWLLFNWVAQCTNCKMVLSVNLSYDEWFYKSFIFKMKKRRQYFISACRRAIILAMGQLQYSHRILQQWVLDKPTQACHINVLSLQIRWHLL